MIPDKARLKLIKLAVKTIQASKATKLSTEYVVECIMDAMDHMGLDDSCEIDDALICEVEEKAKQKVVLTEEVLLARANNEYDRIVSQPIPIKPAKDTSDDDNWASYTGSYERKKNEWEHIQDKIDMLHKRLEQAIMCEQK